jgi:hypothetical protein
MEAGRREVHEVKRGRIRKGRVHELKRDDGLDITLSAGATSSSADRGTSLTIASALSSQRLGFEVG